MSVPVKLLPAEERPREKLLRLGPEKLTDAELLAIVLRTGVRGQSVLDLAHRILQHGAKQSPQSPLQRLRELTQGDIRSVVPGIGDAKACQVVAALHLGLRLQAEPLTVYDVSNPQAVFAHLTPRMSWREQEQFMVILLNAKNHVISVEEVTEGTQTSTLVHAREVYKKAIRRNAHAIVVAHNHPSGDPTPSREDREITLRLKDAGETLGIALLDHLVIGDRRFVSFRERGLPPWS